MENSKKRSSQIAPEALEAEFRRPSSPKRIKSTHGYNSEAALAGSSEPQEVDAQFFTKIKQLEALLGPPICSICERNIAKSVKVRCLDCPPELDFFLCLECLRCGAVPKNTPENNKLYPKEHTHQPDHDYFIFDNMNFPLLTPDWTAW